MKVLYATDGLTPALEAGRLLEQIARREDLDVTVLSVAYAGVPAPEHAIFMLDPLPSRREDALALVDAAAERLQTVGFSVKAKVREGHPAREILDEISEEWYDLTVIGAGNRTWLSSRLLGSVATRLLHSSPSSVLIVHEARRNAARSKILFATDGSRGSDKATRWFSHFADPARCSVTTLCVGPETDAFFHPVPGSVTPGELAKVRKDLNDRAYRHAELLAESTAQQLRLDAFQASAQVALGSAAEQVLKEAESGEYDMTVVGSRGAGTMRRALVGSVSDQVARHARATFVARRFVVNV